MKTSRRSFLGLFAALPFVPKALDAAMPIQRTAIGDRGDHWIYETATKGQGIILRVTCVRDKKVPIIKTKLGATFTAVQLIDFFGMPNYFPHRSYILIHHKKDIVETLVWECFETRLEE